MVIIEGKGIGGSMVQGKLYRLQKTVDKAYTPLAPKEEAVYPAQAGAKLP